MNDETISYLGGFCMELLGDERFQALIQMHSQQCAVDMLNTQPHETKAREYIYASYQGFESFLALARKFGAAAEKPATPNTPTATPDQLDEFDDPSVHDIYDGKN